MIEYLSVNYMVLNQMYKLWPQKCVHISGWINDIIYHIVKLNKSLLNSNIKTKRRYLDYNQKFSSQCSDTTYTYCMNWDTVCGFNDVRESIKLNETQLN